MKRSKLLFNSGANMAGRLAAAGSSMIAAPIIIHAIGREGFGVISFTLSFLALSSLLDLGLAATANRSIAKATEKEDSSAEQSDLLRTFELLYWAGAVIIIGSSFAVSGWIARDWLKLGTLGPRDAALVVVLTGSMLGLRFPVGLYSGVLFGLRRHGYQNLVFGAFSALRYLGGAAIVVFVSPSVLAYSEWLAVTGLAEMCTSAIVAWALIGGRHSFLAGRFRTAILVQHWRFSLMFAATGAVGSLWASSDRIIVGKLLPTSDLGLYGLLYTPAGALTMVSAALAVAAFPEFAIVTSQPDLASARALFVRAQVLTTACILTISVPLVVHYGSILRLWTRDAAIAHDGHMPGVLLVAAMAVNALANPSYTCFVASGRPRIALAWNLAALVILPSTIVLLVPRLGLSGAATGVLLVNLCGLVFFLVMVHRLLALSRPSAQIGGILLLSASLVFCNVLIAVASWSEWAKVVTGLAVSALLGLFYAMRTGMLQPTAMRAVEEE